MVLALGSRGDAARLAPSPQGEGTERFLLLDGLRGILALSVAIHHFSSTSLHRDLFSCAGLAVDFFFCLSGFVLAHAYESKLRSGMTLTSFMQRRLVRLYPMYLMGLALGIAAVMLARPAARHALGPLGSAGAALANLAYVPYPNAAAIPVQAIVVTAALFPFNGPAWSLFFELAANAAYVAVARISTGALAAVVALFALGTFASWIEYGPEPGWSRATFVGGAWRVSFGFFSGVLLHRWHRPGRRAGGMTALAVALLVIAMVAAPLATPGSAYWVGATILVVPLVVRIAAGCHFAMPAAGSAFCRYSGRVSYPLYCLHYPLLVALFGAGATSGRTYGLEFAGYLAVVIGVSHVLLTRLDEPLRQRLSAAGRFA